MVIKRKYRGYFHQAGTSCVFINIRDENNNYVMRFAIFKPFPNTFKKLNLKEGDEVSFYARGYLPQVYGLKHPTKAKKIRVWDNEKGDFKEFVDKFIQKKEIR